MDNTIDKLKEYQTESDKIEEEYVKFVTSKDKKIHIDKGNQIQNNLSQFLKKLRESRINCNEIKVNFNVNGTIEKHPVRIESSLTYIMKDNGWKLSVCGVNGKIKNNGLTFDSSDDCLARTTDAMTCNSGIYKIEWKIEQSGGKNNALGICTNHYTQGSQQRQSWCDQLYHIGWNAGGRHDGENTPHGLACSRGKRSENVFFKQCKFVGDTLPSFKENDIVGLLYDSFRNELWFELNGNRLNCKLTKLPTNVEFFWFAAKWNTHFKCSITIAS